MHASEFYTEPDSSEEEFTESDSYEDIAFIEVSHVVGVKKRKITQKLPLSLNKLSFQEFSTYIICSL